MQAAALIRMAGTFLLGATLGWAGTHWLTPAPAGRMPTGAAIAAPAELDFAAVEASLSRLPPARRQAILDDATAFAGFVEQRGQQQILAAAAVAAGLIDQAAVKASIAAAVSETLAARYLDRQAPVDALTPPDEATVNAFYRDQQTRFKVPDRLPVWQIFIAAPADDESQRNRARTRAREVLERLLAGKATLTELAVSTSDHAPSRVNGGFMGLLAPEELKPEVRQALLTAPQGKPVGPVETDAGFHIVQRGALVTGSVPPLAEVRPKIEAFLSERALAERRAAVVRAAAEAHPLHLPAAQVHAWRARLREAAAAAATESSRKN